MGFALRTTQHIYNLGGIIIHMQKKTAKIINYVLIILFTVFLLVENIRQWHILSETLMSHSLFEFILISLFGASIGIGGVLLIYYYLIRMRKRIYGLLFVGGIILAVTYLFRFNTLTDKLMIFVVILPLIICSFLIMKYHHF